MRRIPLFGMDYLQGLMLICLPIGGPTAMVARLSGILERKPKMLVAIALANKMARQIWAMLTKKDDDKDPALVGPA